MQPLHRALGLTDWEADRIQELLGREPNHFELAVFSLLWSEHCGYKHSAPLLKRLPSRGDRVLQGPGENAGVLDLGEGVAVVIGLGGKKFIEGSKKVIVARFFGAVVAHGPGIDQSVIERLIVITAADCGLGGRLVAGRIARRGEQ